MTGEVDPVRLTQPFIRLPWKFDAERLAAEMLAVRAGAWMPHPSGLAGNSAVALVSRGGADNDDFAGAMEPTQHLEESAYHRQVLAHFDEVLARSRWMKLAPGHEVSLHVDFNHHWRHRVRMHIPLVTTPEVIFTCGPESVHMAAGECWLFDNWRRHQVVNAGPAERVHLVIDLAGSAAFWQGVRDAQQAQAQGAPLGDRAVPFDPEVSRMPETERFNDLPVMVPGELDALVEEVITDFSAQPRNDPRLVAGYRQQLLDFARDWRALWHRHGLDPRGEAAYRAAMQELVSGLLPNPRALLMASNGVGVNPVIRQRILAAVLMPELFQVGP